MSKSDSENPAAVLGTTAVLASGVNNTLEKEMNSEHEHLEPEEWPKGLYMIFAVNEKDAEMGKVIGLTSTTALVHPWSFMFGGIDNEVTRTVVLADFKEFIPFDDLWEMDEYFNMYYWSYITGEKTKEGTTNE